jgi:hypothetical protein
VYVSVCVCTVFLKKKKVYTYVYCDVDCFVIFTTTRVVLLGKLAVVIFLIQGMNL